MKIGTRFPKPGIVTLEPSGEITIKGGDLALRKVMQLASDKHVILDFAKVTTVDASGIGEIVAAYTTVLGRGRRLVLLRLPPKLNELFHVTQLITVFDVYDNEEEAVASFS